MVQTVISVIALLFIIGLFTSILPVEFSSYTLTSFRGDLDASSNFFLTSLAYFSPFIDVVLLLLVIKLILLALSAGLSIKIAVFIANLLSGGGA